jgi:hypothetical protein
MIVLVPSLSLSLDHLTTLYLRLSDTFNPILSTTRFAHDYAIHGCKRLSDAIQLQGIEALCELQVSWDL